jgi:glycosyltransferase involved in cell wall biosynthesis
MAAVTLICVTPVKNEAWILDRFLRCASQWADHIVIADQGSEDGSREIARQFPKVTLVENPSPVYDEGKRQRLLLEAARQIPVNGRRVIIALDADELLSCAWQDSPEWGRVLAAVPGTVIRFRWVNILPGFTRSWIPAEDIPFGFVDDGSSHVGAAIHSSRLPTPVGAPVLALSDIKVLHFQYVDWQRMKAKQRWYQCWEAVKYPRKRAVQIYRQYHRMDARPRREIFDFRVVWIARYEQMGIDLRDFRSEGPSRWDLGVLSMVLERGPQYFRKIAIWDIDWNLVSRSGDAGHPGRPVNDPRNKFDRWVHRWLGATQSRADHVDVRAVQMALRCAGW